MTRIVCGFCASVTDGSEPCVNCRHDPLLPYAQRGAAPVPADASLRLSAATRALGATATTEQLAEHLGVEPRTVRRWRADVRSAT